MSELVTAAIFGVVLAGAVAFLWCIFKGVHSALSLLLVLSASIFMSGKEFQNYLRELSEQ